MKADAVFFDKDGTLMDFDAFWVTVSVKALGDVLRQLGKQDVPVREILQSLGVRDSGTDIDGVLCKGTYNQIGQIVYEILYRYGCNASCKEVTDVVTDAFIHHSDAGEIKPTCPNLPEILTSLKQRNKKLAVVTTDNEEITRKCLKKLGIEELFDKIYTDDGKTPTKPDPYCAEDFLRLTGLEKEKAVMVGDTMTDVNFAKNAGITIIGVAKNEQNMQILKPHTDTVIPNLSNLLGMLE